MRFDTVSIANRGEIAVRVIRTLRPLGIRSVAVFSDADAERPPRRGRRHRGRHRAGAAPESYLDIDAVVDAALRTGAGASTLATASSRRTPALRRGAAQPPASCSSARRPQAIELMGDKIAAKAHGRRRRRAGRARHRASRV